ncbi:UDP-glucosyltransferase 2 [Drosophila simulans]|uniref:UDP-glucosyltransferase 2 n=1 Tax=Drosophila simulans TaxID=7240 RepID=UPI00192D010E|nr:UDP-glucosyltransferase 2 [Drosophila simulans]
MLSTVSIISVWQRRAQFGSVWLLVARLIFITMRIFTLILGLLCTLGYSSGYNYLMVLNSAGSSHFNVGHALAKGLVKAGHTITVVSVFPQKKPIPG